MNERAEWLASLKAGDEVVRTSALGGGGESGAQVRKVKRATSTLVIVGDGDQEERYRLADGRLSGQTGYYYTTIVEPTPSGWTPSGALVWRAVLKGLSGRISRLKHSARLLRLSLLPEKPEDAQERVQRH